MNIAYCSAFYPYRGGIAQFNARLFRALEARHNVRAYTFTRQYPSFLFPGKTQEVTPGDTADAIPAFRLLDSINPVTYFSTAKTILQNKPDVYISKFWIPFLAPSLGTVSYLVRKQGVPTIGILGNVLPHEQRPGDKLLARYFLNNHDAFIVMSAADADHLQELHPKATFIIKEHPVYDHFGDKVEKLHARQFLQIPNDKKVLLFFGFIREYKGLDIAIECLQYLPDDYILVVGGECYGNFEPYQQLIERLNLQHRVILHNRYIADSEVTTFFSASDVTLLPYKTATQSGITKISFHFEQPVIVTDVGGLKEAVAPNGTGMVAPIPSAEAVAKTVLQFFGHSYSPALYADAIRLYNAQHSWDSYAKAVEHIYAQLQHKVR
jgi:glycosyltransferase involved in cell wall biosynthesis